METREATMRVPCTGEFDILVCADGFWEVCLRSNAGQMYHRSRGTMLRTGLMMDHHNMTSRELPDWMWEAIHAKINELKLTLECEALNTPQLPEVWV